MTLFRKEQGKYGEDLAAHFLRKIGYKVIERNFLIRGGEIDLIALDGDVTVIIEVKLRGSNDFGSAIEAITTSKLRSLIKTCRFYAQEKNVKGSLRIDLVAIDVENGKIKVEHIKNITESLNPRF